VATWESLAEMDLRFARSRRRAQARHRLPPRRSPLAWRSVRAGALALVLLAVVAESTPLDRSKAKSPQRAAAAAAPRSLGVGCPVAARFRTAFASASAQTGVSAALLVATAYEESRMNPGARSGVGARGLLQLMPATAHQLRIDGPAPATNVLAGAWSLKEMINRFGSLELGLAAYNAGPTAVERSGGAPTISTLRYVKNVELRASELVGC
jgi:soluble lytic murein transglycosylase-like protein